MVVFTCNHCGESLQKPRVEKHYNLVCRRSKSLTCVDCLKDFLEEDYVAHTKCISEAERYAAKGAVMNTVKKGEAKQESWMEMIQAILKAETNLPPGPRNLLNSVSQSSNVPRKKKKFVNFVTSAFGGRAKSEDVETIWCIIEKHKQAKEQENRAASAELGKKVNGDSEKVNNNENVSNVPEKKKKRKSKADKEMNIDEENNVEKSSKKKKRKSEIDHEGVMEESHFKISSEQGVEEELGLSKKKKRKSKGNTNHEIDPQQANDEVPAKKSKKQKKLKTDVKDELIEENAVPDHSENNHNGISKNEDIKISNEIQTDDVIEKSGKKKKHEKKCNKVETVNSEAVGTNQTSGEEESELPKKKKCKSKSSDKLDETTKSNTDDIEEEKTGEVGSIPNSVSDVTDQIENGGTGKKNKKQKKNKSSSTDMMQKDEKNDSINENKKPHLNGDLPDQNTDDCAIAEANVTANFSFEKEILAILKPNKLISVPKLEKKVLNAYLKQTDKTDISDKLTKKFNKCLKKINGIEFTENNVKLIGI